MSGLKRWKPIDVSLRRYIRWPGLGMVAFAALLGAGVCGRGPTPTQSKRSIRERWALRSPPHFATSGAPFVDLPQQGMETLIHLDLAHATAYDPTSRRTYIPAGCTGHGATFVNGHVHQTFDIDGWDYTAPTMSSVICTLRYGTPPSRGPLRALPLATGDAWRVRFLYAATLLLVMPIFKVIHYAMRWFLPKTPPSSARFEMPTPSGRVFPFQMRMCNHFFPDSDTTTRPGSVGVPARSFQSNVEMVVQGAEGLGQGTPLAVSCKWLSKTVFAMRAHHHNLVFARLSEIRLASGGRVPLHLLGWSVAWLAPFGVRVRALAPTPADLDAIRRAPQQSFAWLRLNLLLLKFSQAYLARGGEEVAVDVLACATMAHLAMETQPAALSEYMLRMLARARPV
jgi:hypothetical protein